MSDPAEKIVQAIDRFYAGNQGDGFRDHLGASILGQKCPRSIWYSFRWAYQKHHTGRMIRLFGRGHSEEPKLVQWLREAGAVVHETDPETGHQFRIVDHNGHFGGSCDGIVENLERFGLEGRGLLEFKTHNDKSFKELKTKGVATAKGQHYIQMQLYMHYLGLPWALYVAINKNDDTLYMEVVHYRASLAEQLIDKSRDLIGTQHPPKKINEDGSWFECKFCDYRHVCQNGGKLHKNCRSCINAKPVLEGEAGAWYCDKWKQEIPKKFLRSGCDEWEPIA